MPRPFREPAIPLEVSTRDRQQVIRAELPGLDPQREIGIMVADNEITIEIRRPVHLPGPADGWFHEQPQRRTLRLPRGAKDETLTATYDGQGILELRVELAFPVPIGRIVPITAG
jgi:HSP20 family molecular chaperone IbpA